MDPATKIIKTANDLNVDIIVLGTTGLGNSDDLGHIQGKFFLNLTNPYYY
jgi:urea-proton symporter